MKKKPGRTISLYELLELVPDEESAAAYFEHVRWRGKPVCPTCGSFNVARCAKPQPYRCRDCRKHFSVRTGTIMADSRIPLRKWLCAGYLLYTARKGISSYQLGRMLKISQKSAWYLLHRLREAMGQDDVVILEGEVEVDETYVGGLERNKHASKRLSRTQGGKGKEAVFGMRQRGGKTVAMPVPSRAGYYLLPEIYKHVRPGSTIYSDEHGGYRAIEGYDHHAVGHKRHEYVRGQVHTNNIESVWALLKRGHKGVYHKMSGKHLHRYVNEYTDRVNTIELSSYQCLDRLIARMVGLHLPYRNLIR